jgi:hypothetical protein
LLLLFIDDCKTKCSGACPQSWAHYFCGSWYWKNVEIVMKTSDEREVEKM